MGPTSSFETTSQDFDEELDCMDVGSRGVFGWEQYSGLVWMIFFSGGGKENQTKQCKNLGSLQSIA